MTFDLKPCPFCGADAEFFVNSGVRVRCKVCGAQTLTLTDHAGGGGSVNRVTEKWNRRAEESPKEQSHVKISGVKWARGMLERVRAEIDHIDEPPEVTEMCPSCEREITLLWDTEQDGYKAYCPYCGERLMLCTACHDDGRDPADRTAFGKCLGCDYKSDADSCIHNPKIADEEGNEK